MVASNWTPPPQSLPFRSLHCSVVCCDVAFAAVPGTSSKDHTAAGNGHAAGHS